MPNWVINHVECDNLQALADLRDFNRIVPEPVAITKTESGPDVGHYLQQRRESRTLSEILQNPPRYQWASESKTHERIVPLDEWQRKARRYYLCQKLYGYCDWYAWRSAHWGCKWSASEYQPYEDNGCIFHTPWRTPDAVLVALSCKYQEATISVRFADECIGDNAGYFVLRNGEFIVPDTVIEGSVDAFEIAFDLWGCEDYYRYNPEIGTYEFFDPDEVADEETAVSHP